jgi:hypothetical protein
MCGEGENLLLVLLLLLLLPLKLNHSPSMKDHLHHHLVIKEDSLIRML